MLYIANYALMEKVPLISKVTLFWDHHWLPMATVRLSYICFRLFGTLLLTLERCPDITYFFLIVIVLIYIKQILKHYFSYHTLSKVAFVYFLFRLEILFNNNVCFKHSIKKGGGVNSCWSIKRLLLNNSFCSYKHRYSMFSNCIRICLVIKLFCIHITYFYFFIKKIAFLSFK